MEGVAEGLIFDPTDESLITTYLLKKATGQRLPWNGVIERVLYGDNASPWDVFTPEDPWQRSTGNSDDRNTIFVFTKLIKVNGKKRIVRKAGCGTWDGQTGTKLVKNRRGVVIGSKKMFVFEVNGNSEERRARGHWIMHEYSIDGRLFRGIEHDDYVVCRIKRDYSKILKRKPRVGKNLGHESNRDSGTVSVVDEAYDDDQENLRKRKFGFSRENSSSGQEIISTFAPVNSGMVQVNPMNIMQQPSSEVLDYAVSAAEEQSYLPSLIDSEQHMKNSPMIINGSEMNQTNALNSCGNILDAPIIRSYTNPPPFEQVVANQTNAMNPCSNNLDTPIDQRYPNTSSEQVAENPTKAMSCGTNPYSSIIEGHTTTSFQQLLASKIRESELRDDASLIAWLANSQPLNMESWRKNSVDGGLPDLSECLGFW